MQGMRRRLGSGFMRWLVGHILDMMKNNIELENPKGWSFSAIECSVSMRELGVCELVLEMKVRRPFQKRHLLGLERPKLFL